LIVIADTGPLNYLILVGEAEILRKLFGHVVIPTAVSKELQRERTPEVVRKWMGTPPAWLEIRSVDSAKAVELDYLGLGEREAILLAEEVRADWLIIDDYAGRQEAARRNLPVMGTLRVLDEAATRSLINLTEIITRLQQTTFYLSAELIQWLLDRDAKRHKGAQ
jgi:predicted nucleic acid-binding protein